MEAWIEERLNANAMEGSNGKSLLNRFIKFVSR